jgi:hypothetical protein
MDWGSKVIFPVNFGLEITRIFAVNLMGKFVQIRPENKDT